MFCKQIGFEYKSEQHVNSTRDVHRCIGFTSSLFTNWIQLHQHRDERWGYIEHPSSTLIGIHNFARCAGRWINLWGLNKLKLNRKYIWLCSNGGISDIGEQFAISKAECRVGIDSELSHKHHSATDKGSLDLNGRPSW